MLSETEQQRLEKMLRPTIASIQEQVAQAAELQLAPLRARLQQLAEQRRNGQVEQETSAAPSQALVPVPAAEAKSHEAPEKESALQRWGESLESFALPVLAVGEMLDGIALILQSVDELVPTRFKVQGGELSSQENGGEGGEPLFQKLGQVFAKVATALRQLVSQLLGDSPVQQGLKGVMATLPQWGQILEHASALIQALGDRSSFKQQGASFTENWGLLIKHGPPLIKDLSQVLGGLFSQQEDHGGNNVQRWGQVLGRAASVLQALGDGSSPKQDDVSSSRQERDGGSLSEQERNRGSSQQGRGGIPSALEALAGGTSSRKTDDEGSSSPLDMLFGEDSPLQALREFSKRQEGPAGLAPKGPLGRKPPPGPLRRDRIPGAHSLFEHAPRHRNCNALT
jgi:hypothetical protein